MAWYAAHAIMACRFKDGRQSPTPVWENVLLIEAADGDEAEERAVDRAKLDEGDSDGSMTWDGRPAEWVFVGIRRMISVAHQSVVGKPHSGDEITFLEFVLPDMSAVEALAAGKTVRVEYLE